MKSFYPLKFCFVFKLVILLNLLVQAQTPKPGDISPNAKYIDADGLHPFNSGAALVYKGATTVTGATALIDKNGNFIAPYNKYTILYEFTDRFADRRKYAFYNTGLYIIGKDDALLNSKGEVVSKSLVINDFTYCNCRLIPFVTKLTSTTYSKYGYKDKNGKIVVSSQYEEASKFSNGMAVVGAKDQYGEMKYGYIDSTGKLNIPLMYSRTPENFYGETAIVYPKIGSDFAWALINKKGEIIQKYGDREFVPAAATYFHGMRNDARSSQLLGYNGKVITHAEFLATIGIKPNSPHEFDELLNIDCGDGKIYYKRRIITDQRTQRIITGFVDIYTGKKMEGPFEEGFYFDKNSGLALAKIILGRNKVNTPIVRYGYINEDGIFVIVKKESPVF